MATESTSSTSVAFTLTANDDPTNPYTFTLGGEDGPVKIGRYKKNHIIVNHAGASAVHLEIRASASAIAEGRKAIVVRDVSSNGVGIKTANNLRRVEPKVDVEVPQGSSLIVPFRVKPTEGQTVESLQTALSVHIEGAECREDSPAAVVAALPASTGIPLPVFAPPPLPVPVKNGATLTPASADTKRKHRSRSRSVRKRAAGDGKRKRTDRRSSSCSSSSSSSSKNRRKGKRKQKDASDEANGGTKDEANGGKSDLLKEMIAGSAAALADNKAAQERAGTGRKKASKKTAFTPGQLVRIVALKSKAELNGRVGTIVEFDPGAGIWKVRMEDGTGKAFRPVNLEAADNGDDTVKAKNNKGGEGSGTAMAEMMARCRNFALEKERERHDPPAPAPHAFAQPLAPLAAPSLVGASMPAFMNAFVQPPPPPSGTAPLGSHLNFSPLNGSMSMPQLTMGMQMPPAPPQAQHLQAQLQALGMAMPMQHGMAMPQVPMNFGMPMGGLGMQVQMMGLPGMQGMPGMPGMQQQPGMHGMSGMPGAFFTAQAPAPPAPQVAPVPMGGVSKSAGPPPPAP